MGYTETIGTHSIEGFPHSAEVAYGEDGENYTEFTVVFRPPIRANKEFLETYAGVGQDGFTTLKEQVSTPEFSLYEGTITKSREELAGARRDSETTTSALRVRLGIEMTSNLLSKVNRISSGDISN